MIYIYYYIYTQLFIYTYIYICILDALVSFLRFFQDKGANSQVSGYFPGFNIPCARCTVWYIYFQLGDIVRSNVVKYSIHGAYGYVSI